MTTSNPSGRYKQHWIDALVDAKIDPEGVPFPRYGDHPARVRVSFRDRELLPDDTHAALFAPGVSCASLGQEFAIADEGIQDTFRILVCVEGRSDVLVGGLIRHELEHVRQVSRCRPIETVHKEASYLLGRVGLTGTEYNEMPMEREANRAARDFVRNRYGDEALESLAVRPEWPILTPGGAADDPEATVHEMLAYAGELGRQYPDKVTYDYREALERVRAELTQAGP